MRLVLVAALVLSSVSFAQTNAAEPKRKVPQSEIKFDTGDDVFGTPVGPDGILIQDGPKVEFKSLIRVRQNFSDKLMNSVNDLR